MKTKVVQYIESNNLIDKNDKVVVGVSGGADSMCLLHILHSLRKEYNIDLLVAHINHGVRKEAKEDAKYVEDICAKWGIPYFQHNCNIAKLSKINKCSEEEAGRSERYNFFRSIKSEYNATKIATAHTMNDQVETMLMRMVRGSGLTGLGGIRAKRDSVIRPILCLTREEVEDYCSFNNIEFKDDKTNKMDIYTRNKMRLSVLPILKKEFNPNVIENMANLSEMMQQTEEYLDFQIVKACKEVVSEYKNGYSVDITIFKTYHKAIQTGIIRSVIQSLKGNLKNITYKHIISVYDLINRQSGKQVDLGSGLIGIREHNNIRIIRQEKNIKYSSVLELGNNIIRECNKKVTLSLSTDVENIQRHRNTYTKNIDYDKINGNLQIRNRRSGDRIVLGNGSKKLKDFFIDEKIPKTSRDDIILIADDINVIWVVGYRLSELYYITDKTKQMLEIQISDI